MISSDRYVKLCLSLSETDACFTKVPLANDIRPYFTIHDKDHTSLVNKMPPKTGLIIGVTNPFFDKSCAHWPHVLSLGRRSVKLFGLNKIINYVACSNGKKSMSMAITGPSPGWVTKTHKRFISKDRHLLKQLEDAIRGSEKTSTYRPKSGQHGHLMIINRNGSIHKFTSPLLQPECSDACSSE